MNFAGEEVVDHVIPSAKKKHIVLQDWKEYDLTSTLGVIVEV